jgi:hypothetical protein
MIIASINEIPGFGFAEMVQSDDGRTHRAGTLEIAPINTPRLQRVLERGEPLVYSGPVWVDDHWATESFHVTLSEATDRETCTRLQFVERAD